MNDDLPIFFNQPANVNVTKLTKLLGTDPFSTPPGAVNSTANSPKPKRHMNRKDRDNEKEVDKEKDKKLDDLLTKRKSKGRLTKLRRQPEKNMTSEVKEEEEFPKEISFVDLIERVTCDSTSNESIFQFLLIYRTICTPQMLLNSILERMDIDIVRGSILLRYWIDNFWNDFGKDKDTLIPILEDYCSKTDNDKNKLLHGIRKRIAFHSGNKEKSDEITFGEAVTDYDGTVNFWTNTAEEIAQQLTLITDKLFKSIKYYEFFGQSWTKAGKETNSPGIVKAINWFNEVSYWIQTELICELNIKTRVRKFSKLLDISEYLLSYQNFDTFLAFFSAFQSVGVHRLTKTLASLPRKAVTMYQKYKKLVDGRDRLQWLRTTASNSVGPFIPYLGLYLTEFVMIDDGNKDSTPSGLINYRKRQMLYNCLQTIHDCQQRTYYYLHPQSDLQDYLLRCKKCRDENFLFEFSKFIEPREDMANPSTGSPDPLQVVPTELDPDKLPSVLIDRFVGRENIEAYFLKIRKKHRSPSSSKKTKDEEFSSEEDNISLFELVSTIEDEYEQQIHDLSKINRKMKKQLEEYEAMFVQIQQDRVRTAKKVKKLKDRIKQLEEEKSDSMQSGTSETIEGRISSHSSGKLSHPLIIGGSGLSEKRESTDTIIASLSSSSHNISSGALLESSSGNKIKVTKSEEGELPRVAMGGGDNIVQQ